MNVAQGVILGEQCLAFGVRDRRAVEPTVCAAWPHASGRVCLAAFRDVRLAALALGLFVGSLLEDRRGLGSVGRIKAYAVEIWVSVRL